MPQKTDLESDLKHIIYMLFSVVDSCVLIDQSCLKKKKKELGFSRLNQSAAIESSVETYWNALFLKCSSTNFVSSTWFLNYYFKTHQYLTKDI